MNSESKSDFASQQPWLLINDGEFFHIQTNMFNNKPLLYDVGTEIPEFLTRNIGCSFGEWVLLTGTYNNLPELLVNLLSKETIELPFLHSAYDFCIITSPPSDPTCHIVYFNQEKNALIFCQPGAKEFTTLQWDYKFFPDGVRAAVAGKLFLTLPERSTFSVMVMVEFKESTYGFEVVKMDSGIRYLGCEFFYFEYSGDLFAVYKMKIRLGFKICKADFLNKKWVPVKSLGRVAVFIGHETAHAQCASVESGIMENCIYFLERDDLDNYYIYNLEEGTIRMKPAFSSMEMETTEDTELDWIIMMHSHTSFPKLLKEDQETICQDSEKENKASEEVEEVGLQDSWNTVPLELLNLIQLHLFGRDHAVFRVVCKVWRQVSIQDPPLLSASTLLEMCQSVSPLFMFQEDITVSYDRVPIFRFFDPVHRKLCRTGIPELRETDIHCSRDGWLLVSRHSDESIFFFNPLTQEKIELPTMPFDSYFSSLDFFSLSFSSPPTCSNCLVVVLEHFAKPICMYTLKHGEETWRRQEVDDFQNEERRQYGHCPVVLNGLHHVMCENRDMVVFNLKDCVEGHLRASKSWSSKFKRSPRGEDFFLEINGGLAFVSVEPDGGEISIFKLNDLETDWELMEDGVDFGGKMMFLSKRGSFMEKIDDVGEVGNTIFVPMIEDAKEGVFYSLATSRYHTFYSGYSSELPYNVDKFLDGIWIKPDKKIVGDKNLKWFM